MFTFIQKPFAPAQIITAVSNLLNTGTTTNLVTYRKEPLG
jgi:hypothetical protein